MLPVLLFRPTPCADPGICLVLKQSSRAAELARDICRGRLLGTAEQVPGYSHLARKPAPAQVVGLGGNARLRRVVSSSHFAHKSRMIR